MQQERHEGMLVEMERKVSSESWLELDVQSTLWLHAQGGSSRKFAAQQDLS